MKNCVSIVLALLLICLAFTGCGKRETGAARDEKTDVSSSSSIETSSVVSVPEEPTPAGLDANFSILLLANPDNPLPKDYDATNPLLELPAKYLNGELKQVDAEIYPYLMAMLEAA